MRNKDSCSSQNIGSDSIVIPHEAGVNSYLSELAVGLKGRGYGVRFCPQMPDISNGETLWVHWPEQLTNYRIPTDKELSEIEKWLKAAYKSSVVIWTIHNLYRHGSPDNKGFNTLYELVAEYSHIHVHHGRSSIGKVKKRYPNAKPIITKIINHGGYWNLIGPLRQKEARLKLNLKIKTGDRVVLVFGSIRTSEEYLLVSQVARLKGIKLVIAGRLPYIRLRHRAAIFFNKLFYKNSILIVSGMIDEKDIDKFLKACDVVFIPRVDGLNSGNVFLGFTFSRVVVGPDVGNIGEILRKTNNFVYNPSRKSTIKDAFNLRNFQSIISQGAANYKWLDSNCRWEDYAISVVDAINSVKSNGVESIK